MSPFTRNGRRRRGAEKSSIQPSSKSTLDPIQSDDLKPFTCARKIKDKDLKKLLEYFPNLPEKTQYFDTGKLLVTRLNPDDYYTNQLSLQRAVSLFQSDSDPGLNVKLGSNIRRYRINFL